MIVGSAIIEQVTSGDGIFRWHLSGIDRKNKPRMPKRHPQPA